MAISNGRQFPMPFENPRVAAIIPAYNEANRVVAVLETIARSRSVGEVLCVTDGCSDDTAAQVAAFIAAREATFDKAATAGHTSAQTPVRLFELTCNIGKGGAMAHGAHHTDAEVLLFLDADLIGLQPLQVDEMLEPMLRAAEPADMTLGLFGAVRGGPLGWWLSWCHRATPSITGQRAIRRDLFLSTPGLTRSRFGVEAAITRWVQSDPSLKVDFVYLHSVTHPIKEEKLGLIRGSRNRMRMYRDIGQTLVSDVARQQAVIRREKALRWFERLTK